MEILRNVRSHQGWNLTHRDFIEFDFKKSLFSAIPRFVIIVILSNFLRFGSNLDDDDSDHDGADDENMYNINILCL